MASSSINQAARTGVYDKFRAYRRIRDAIQGSARIKAGGSEYLSRPDGMSVFDYDFYRDRANYFAVVDRTLRSMVGMIFRKETQIELPKLLEPMRDDATPTCAPLHIMIQKVAREVLAMGQVGLLLEVPRERASNETPYIATFTAENILDHKTRWVKGRRKLVRVHLREDFDEDDDGATGRSEQNDGERELRLIINANGQYEQQVWQSSGEGGEMRMIETVVPMPRGQALDEIPFVFINTNDLEPDNDLPPPMEELTEKSISLYQNSADLEQALYTASIAIPTIIGSVTDDEKPSTISSTSAWMFADENVKVDFVETQGNGIKVLRDEMATKKEEMAALGARMINDGKVRNEAAETARQRGNDEMSLMASTVNMVEAGIEQTLKMAADWMQANPEDVNITVNRDWVEANMSPQEIKEMVAAWQSGAFSGRTLHEILQRGEVIPADRTYEEEQELIEEEGHTMGMDSTTSALQTLMDTGQLPGQPKPDDEEDEDDKEDDPDKKKEGEDK